MTIRTRSTGSATAVRQIWGMVIELAMVSHSLHTLSVSSVGTQQGNAAGPTAACILNQITAPALGPASLRCQHGPRESRPLTTSCAQHTDKYKRGQYKQIHPVNVNKSSEWTDEGTKQTAQTIS